MDKNMNLIIAGGWVAISLLLSCTPKATGPVEALRDFVNYRFSKNQSKDALLERTTGKLHQEISNLSEEELNQLVNPTKHKRGPLKINRKSCTENRCNITYTLRFTQLSQGKKAFKAEVKKIALLVRENNYWKISKVTELKTYFEGQEAIKVDTPGEVSRPF